MRRGDGENGAARTGRCKHPFWTRINHGSTALTTGVFGVAGGVHTHTHQRGSETHTQTETFCLILCRLGRVGYIGWCFPGLALGFFLACLFIWFNEAIGLIPRGSEATTDTTTCLHSMWTRRIVGWGDSDATVARKFHVRGLTLSAPTHIYLYSMNMNSISAPCGFSFSFTDYLPSLTQQRQSEAE